MVVRDFTGAFVDIQVPLPSAILPYSTWSLTASLEISSIAAAGSNHLIDVSVTYLDSTVSAPGKIVWLSW